MVPLVAAAPAKEGEPPVFPIDVEIADEEGECMAAELRKSVLDYGTPQSRKTACGMSKVSSSIKKCSISRSVFTFRLCFCMILLFRIIPLAYFSHHKSHFGIQTFGSALEEEKLDCAVFLA